jgi:hypothetical protein
MKFQRVAVVPSRNLLCNVLIQDESAFLQVVRSAIMVIIRWLANEIKFEAS